MKKILLAPDAAPGLPATAPQPPAASFQTPPTSLLDIPGDIKKIESIIAAWKAAKGTGQLHIAIGALATAVDFANHHLNLAPASKA